MRSQPQTLFRFLLAAGRLKTEKRTGWLLDGIRDGESVAEHSWRSGLMALLLAQEERVNPERLCAMLLLHDLAEARTGDLVTADKEQYHSKGPPLHYRRQNHRFVPLAEKRRREAAALRALLKPLGPKARPLRSLLNEYNGRKTRTARLAKDTDILEMALQALEYGRAGAASHPIDHYFRHAERTVRTPAGKRLLKEILAARARNQREPKTQ